MKRIKRFKTKKKAAILKIHATLKECYPKLFCKPYAPFAIGIHEQILDEHTSMDIKVLRVHLKNITSHPLYLLNFINTKINTRFNLDGSIAEDICPKEVHYARVQLIGVMETMEDNYRRKLGDESVEYIISVMGKI